MRRVLFGACVLGVMASGLRAEDPRVPAGWPVEEAKAYLSMSPAPPNAETRRLVKELGADDFAMRERASKELKAKGEAGFPGLWEAVQASKDPEVLARTVEAFGGEFPMPPNFPAAAGKLVGRYLSTIKTVEQEAARLKAVRPNAAGPDWKSAVESALRFSSTDMPNECAVRLYQVLLENERDPERRQMIQAAALAKFNGTQARLAILDGKWDEAANNLRDAIAGSAYWARPDYATLVALREGPGFNPQKTLEGLKLGSAESLQGQMGYYLFRAGGETGRAVDYLETVPAGSERNALIQGLVEGRRYEALTKLSEANGKVYVLDAAVPWQLLGQKAKAAATLAPAIANPESYGAASLGNVMLSLMKADSAQAVIEIAAKRPGQEALAFRILFHQLRVREALAVISDRKLMPIEVVRRMQDAGFVNEARKVLAGIEVDERKLGTNAALYEFELATEWERIGEKAKAVELRNRAYTLVDAFERQAKALDEADRKLSGLIRAMSAGDPTMTTMERIRRTEQIEGIFDLQRQIREERSALSKSSAQSINVSQVQTLKSPEMRQLASYWMKTMRQNEWDSLPLAERYDRAMRIVAQDYPAEIIWKDIVLPESEGVWNPELEIQVKTLHHLKRDDLAQEVLERWARQTKDPTCLAILGDWALEANQAEKALAWYRQAAMVNLTDASLMYRMGVAYTRQAGRREMGRELMNFAPRLVLGDQNMATALAACMRRYEGQAAGDAWLDAYVDRYCRLESASLSEHLARARDAAEARGDYAGAVKMAEQTLFYPVERAGEYPPYVSVMENLAAYHRVRGLEAWSRKNFAGLAEALEKEMENGPPEVGLLEETVPALRAADGAAADRILGRAMERLGAVVEDYPEARVYVEALARMRALRGK